MSLAVSFKRTLAVVALAAVSAFTLVGCDDELEHVQAELVPPPGVPAPLHRGRAMVDVNFVVEEKQVEIAPGTTYTAWTFNGSVPGPMVRVRQGDMVRVTLANPAASTATHNIDLHSVNGPGGGAGATTVAPGETKSFEFKALSPGLYVYHCAAGIVVDHIANGMWGAIMVDKPGGLSQVDKEFYVGQGEYYTTGATGDKGAQDLDVEKLLAEEPSYVTFNGSTRGLIGDAALQASVGERVRIYFANGGPNFTSSFHVIGEIFDKVRNYGSVNASLVRDVQTITVPPGGAAITEFTLDVPGDYKLVDHAISRVSKGGVGTLHVEGPANAAVFNTDAVGADTHDLTAAPPTQAAGGSTPVSAGGGGSALHVSMKDNLFEPKALTVTAGSTVTFNLKNDGKAPHNLRIADQAGSYASAASVVSDPELITAGKTGTLRWTPTVPAVYKFRCDIHPDQMTGTITVH